VLLTAAVLAYQPVWHGGFLWDDQGHVTKPELQSISGLGRIWFELGAAQQYYPITHSLFWVWHRLFGETLLAYHLLTISLHTLAGWMFWRLLARLGVPGAPLAAVVFVLHPVHVESVAWISEIKNTLSAVFFLAAALQYQEFDRSRKPGPYAGALALFVLAVLSKAVTATLPAALLVLIWWKRGAIRWREDVVPLSPFFAVALPLTAVASYVEHTFIGAQGSEFGGPFLDRVLIACRAVVFYASKIVWPANLMFVYPKWTPAWSAAWLMYPAALVVAFATAFLYRHRSRTPLAVLMLFTGILSPALGFVNAFPFRYSFVADHFQYLASLPLLALISALVVMGLRRLMTEPRASLSACVMLGLPLGAATWQYAHHYASVDALYSETIRRNPGAWMAHLNLGVELENRGQIEDAVRHFQQAADIYPAGAEALASLGAGLHKLGRTEEARRPLEEAVRLQPTYAIARSNLGGVYLVLGNTARAESELRAAIELKPRLSEAHYNLGNVLLQTGRYPGAAEAFRTTIDLDRSFVGAYNNLGLALERMGKWSDAVAAYQSALRLERSPLLLSNLGGALAREGKLPDAETALRESLTLDAASPVAHHRLGQVLEALNRKTEADAHYAEAARLGRGR